MKRPSALPAFDRGLAKTLLAETGAALAMGNLAALYLRAAAYDEAQELLEQCLRTQRALLGPGASAAGQHMTHLGEIYMLRRRYAEAEDLFRRSLAIKAKSLAPDHQDLLMTPERAGQIADEHQSEQRGRGIFRAGAGRRRAFRCRPTMPNWARCWSTSGGTTGCGGDWLRRRRLLEEALRILEKLSGSGPSSDTGGTGRAGRSVCGRGRYEAAEAVYRACWRDWKRASAQTPIGGWMSSLAVICRARGRFTEAERFYRRALPLWESFLPPQEYAKKLRELGDLYRADGRPRDAREIEESARKVERSDFYRRT